MFTGRIFMQGTAAHDEACPAPVRPGPCCFRCIQDGLAQI